MELDEGDRDEKRSLEALREHTWSSTSSKEE